MRRMDLRRPAAALACAGAALLLAGCAPEAAPAPTETVTTPPEFDPAGGAAGNLLYFEHILGMAAADGTTDAELRETMQVGGFDGWPVESSGDGTTLSEVAVDAHEIALLGPDGLCLIGTVNAGDGKVAAIVAEPMRSTGRCLIGSAR